MKWGSSALFHNVVKVMWVIMFVRTNLYYPTNSRLCNMKPKRNIFLFIEHIFWYAVWMHDECGFFESKVKRGILSKGGFFNRILRHKRCIYKKGEFYYWIHSLMISNAALPTYIKWISLTRNWKWWDEIVNKTEKPSPDCSDRCLASNNNCNVLFLFTWSPIYLKFCHSHYFSSFIHSFNFSFLIFF